MILNGCGQEINLHFFAFWKTLRPTSQAGAAQRLGARFLRWDAVAQSQCQKFYMLSPQRPCISLPCGFGWYPLYPHCAGSFEKGQDCGDCWMTARCSPTAAIALASGIFWACFLLSCALYRSKSLRGTAHLTWDISSYPHIRLRFPGIKGGLRGPVVPLLNCPLISRKCCCLDPSHMATWWYGERCSVFLQPFVCGVPGSVQVPWSKLLVGFGSKVLWIFAMYKPKPRLLPQWDKEGEKQAVA